LAAALGLEWLFLIEQLILVHTLLVTVAAGNPLDKFKYRIIIKTEAVHATHEEEGTFAVA
jgi:hypothetical protein